MKSVRLAVFLLLGAAVVNAFPQRDVESVEDDIGDVPLGTVPAVAVPVPSAPGFGYIPNYYSFMPDFDLVSRIKGLVTRLSSQIGDTFAGIDWNKGNTTSTSKVIDGHVVTVNETSYKDDDSDLVLHVKVIDVKPTEGAEVTYSTVEAAAGSNEDAEVNEIPNKPEQVVAESREHLIDTRDSLYDDRPVEEVENTVEVRPVAFQPISLLNDVHVNKVLSDKDEMVMIPDDVEFFVPNNRDMYTINKDNEFVYNPNNGVSMYQSAPYVYNPGNNAPVPGYNSPIPSYNSPVPGNSAPVPGYNSPVPGYNSPVPSNSASITGYNAPVPGYNSPVPSNSAPIAGYNAPVPGNSAPVPGYNSPVPGYNSPVPGNSALVPGYNAPVPSISVPVYQSAPYVYNPRHRVPMYQSAPYTYNPSSNALVYESVPYVYNPSNSVPEYAKYAQGPRSEKLTNLT